VCFDANLFVFLKQISQIHLFLLNSKTYSALSRIKSFISESASPMQKGSLAAQALSDGSRGVEALGGTEGSAY
jgi:hypothetical protein